MNNKGIEEKKNSGKKEEFLALLKGIEDELLSLKKEDGERKASYEQKVKDFEIKKIEEELKKEAEEVKEEYPDFDPETELENEVFSKLISAGLPMKTAYEAVHIEEIKSALKSKKEEKEKKLSSRPEENGLGASGGLSLGSGVKSLSKRDRAELARRARMGEIIKL